MPQAEASTLPVHARPSIALPPYSFGGRTDSADAGSISLMRPLHDIERDIVKATIERCHGNQTEAARILQVSRTTIWRLLKD